MSDLFDGIKNACRIVSRQVNGAYSDISVHFIVHRTGQLKETIALTEHEIAGHPASGNAEAILEKEALAGENSRFMGIAVNVTKTAFGLSRKYDFLALININVDKYKTVGEALVDIYHFAWHAMDFVDLNKSHEYRKKLVSGPIYPKRSPLNFARANLQADCFTAIMVGLSGDKRAVEKLARKRAFDAISKVSERRAEDYPFPIAMEATQFIFEDIADKEIVKGRRIFHARQLSLIIGQTFDETSIRQWWAFSEPAQNMAWHNREKEEILGAAVNISSDPYVRATGYLIAEITGLHPYSSISMIGKYNAFASSEKNEKLHMEVINSTFEEAMALGIEEDSPRSFVDAANAQNEALTEGNFLGWCANALQSAAKAFEHAMRIGDEPERAARLEFEGSKTLADWDTVKNLGERIIERRRKGYAVTMGNIAEICSDSPEFAAILNSIKITMNDPEYVRTLTAVNDLDFIPSTPAPKADLELSVDKELKQSLDKNLTAGLDKSAPVPSVPAPAAPGLGGNNRAAQIRRYNMEQQRKKQQEQGRQTEKQTGRRGEDT